MSTVDLTKVAGFKAVDAEGNDIGVVSLSEMTNMVKESIIQEAVAMQSVSTLAEASTLAATDTYEDKLDISDTFSYVRTLDASGNPKRTSQNALATVVGGLIVNDRNFKDLLAMKYPFKNFMDNYTISPGQKIEITLECFNYGLAYIICGKFYAIIHINSVEYQCVDIINSGFTHTEGNQGTINVWRNSGGSIFIENKKSETLTVQVRLFSMEKTDR